MIYIRDYSSVRLVSIWLTNTTHSHSIHHVSWNPLNFNHCCFPGVCSTDNFLDFLCIPNVLSMLHLVSKWRVRSSPRINVKKLHCEEKWAKRVKKPAAGNFFLQSLSDFQLFAIVLRSSKELFAVEVLHF